MEQKAHDKKLDIVAAQEAPIQAKEVEGKWGEYDLLCPRGSPLVALAVRSNLEFEPIWMGVLDCVELCLNVSILHL